jgi:hypothetical protein
MNLIRSNLAEEVAFESSGAEQAFEGIWMRMTGTPKNLHRVHRGTEGTENGTRTKP